MSTDFFFRKLAIKYVDTCSHGDAAQKAKECKISPQVFSKYLSDNPTQNRQPSYEKGLRILTEIGASKTDINKCLKSKRHYQYMSAL